MVRHASLPVAVVWQDPQLQTTLHEPVRHSATAVLKGLKRFAIVVQHVSDLLEI